MKMTRVTFFRSWWFTLFATVFIPLSVRSAVGDWNNMPTVSLGPTILEVDRICVNKLTYDPVIPFTTPRAARWDKALRGISLCGIEKWN